MARNHYNYVMKRLMTAAAVLLLLGVRASAAQFKSGAYEQAADLASGQIAPSVYDGSITLPVLQKSVAPSAQAAASPAAMAAPRPVVPAPSRLEAVPIPQGMEIAVVRAASPAPAAPRRSARDLAAPLGAMIGLATGFSIGFALSKSLA